MPGLEQNDLEAGLRQGSMQPLRERPGLGWSTAVIYDVLRTIAQVIPLKPDGR